MSLNCSMDYYSNHAIVFMHCVNACNYMDIGIMQYDHGHLTTMETMYNYVHTLYACMHG